MKRLFDFFREGRVLVGTAAVAGLAGLLVLMSCGEEEASEERERIGRVISVECGPPNEGEGTRHVDLYFLSENAQGVLSCSGLNMVLIQNETQKATMIPYYS